MATIPFPGSNIRHVRKTINFDGGANNGNLGDFVTVFTTTGRVLVVWRTMYVSDALVCSGAAGTLLNWGTENHQVVGSFTVSEVAGPGFLGDAEADESVFLPQEDARWGAFALAANFGFLVEDDASGADITDGTLVVDAFYKPLTDDGALAGDDIDIEMDDYIAAEVWAAGTRTLTAIDEDSTTLDLDATIRGAVGLAAADLDTQLGALPTAAENADAVWDEAATGHTDAGKAGEQLWTDVDAILADTNELQTDDYPTSIADIEGKVDDLEGRLTATRAGYLDNLSAGAVALESTAQSILTDTGTTLDNLVDDLESRIGTPSDLGSGATVAANLADIKGETAAILDDTDDIGVAGAGLTEAGGTGDHLTALATQSSVNDIPTNSELATALAAADDAVLAAIAALENLSQAEAQVAAAAALTAYDPPTKAELDTAVDALPTAVENADALLGRNIAGGSSSGRIVTDALRALRNRVAIAAGTVTVYQEDDTTSAWTAVATTDDTADPITEVNPS